MRSLLQRGIGRSTGKVQRQGLGESKEYVAHKMASTALDSPLSSCGVIHLSTLTQCTQRTFLSVISALTSVYSANLSIPSPLTSVYSAHLPRYTQCTYLGILSPLSSVYSEHFPQCNQRTYLSILSEPQYTQPTYLGILSALTSVYSLHLPRYTQPTFLSVLRALSSV